MTVDLTHSSVPGPRSAAPSGTAPADLAAEIYRGFLYGFGDAPGLDLGAPVHYRKDGTVFRQEFERGLTLANVGDAPVTVSVEDGYRDLTGARRSRLVLAPRTGAVLLVDA